MQGRKYSLLSLVVKAVGWSGVVAADSWMTSVSSCGVAFLEPAPFALPGHHMKILLLTGPVTAAGANAAATTATTATTTTTTTTTTIAVAAAATSKGGACCNGWAQNTRHNRA